MKLGERGNQGFIKKTTKKGKRRLSPRLGSPKYWAAFGPVGLKAS